MDLSSEDLIEQARMGLEYERNAKPDKKFQRIRFGLISSFSFVLVLSVLNISVAAMPPSLYYPNFPLTTQPKTMTQAQEVNFAVITERCAIDPFEFSTIKVGYQPTIVNADTNREVVTLDEREFTITDGCHVAVNTTINLPPLTVGRYYMKGWSLAHGRWKASRVEWYTDAFAIVDGQ